MMGEKISDEKSGGLDKIGMAAAILGAALFSTKPVIIKLIYEEDVPVTSLLALRMSMALPFYLVIGFFAYRRRPATAHRIPPKVFWAAVANGILGYYLASYFDLAGLLYITAQFERLILFTYPFFVVILGTLFFGLPLKRWTFPALIIAYAGLAVIFWRSASMMDGDDVIKGAGLVFAAAVAFSLFQLFGKKLVGQIGAPVYTSIAMSAAAFGVLVHFLAVTPAGAWVFSDRVLWLCFLMATLSTVAPSYLLNFALGRIGADGTAMVGNLGPLFTILLAANLLGEPFGIYEALGTGLVIAAMFLFTRK